MGKITSAKEALAALHSNLVVYDALRFFATSKDEDTELIFQEYFMSLSYADDVAKRIATAVIQYMNSSIESRTYLKLTYLKLEIPLSLLFILSKVYDQHVVEDFAKWRKALNDPLVTAFIIDDDKAGCFLHAVMTNFSLKPILNLGSAHNFEESIEPVMLAKPDILIIDHMMPGYNGLEVMLYYRQRLPDSVFIFRSYLHHQEKLQQQAKTVGADFVIHYGPFFPAEKYVDFLLECHRLGRQHP